jgi:hypothetical protein
MAASPNIIRVIKLRRVKWAGHVARIKGVRNAYRGYLRPSLGVIGRAILKLILKVYGVRI